jgi:hypothetical protein
VKTRTTTDTTFFAPPPTTAAPPTTTPATTPPTTVAPYKPAVLQTETGSGGNTYPQFTVPAAASGWNIEWTYNCANFGTTGNFQIYINGFGAAADTTDSGVNQLGAGSSGTDSNSDTGTFSIEVNSECNWSYKVVTT